jgi:hypothetical protein
MKSRCSIFKNSSTTYYVLLTTDSYLFVYYELTWFPLSVILIEGVFSNTGPLENNKQAYWALLKEGAFKISTPQEIH